MPLKLPLVLELFAAVGLRTLHQIDGVCGKHVLDYVHLEFGRERGTVFAFEIESRVCRGLDRVAFAVHIVIGVCFIVERECHRVEKRRRGDGHAKQ